MSGMGIANTMDFSWMGFTRENFILAFFVLATRVIDILIRGAKKREMCKE